MFRFFDDSSTDALSLFMHVCGDFGAAGMPGTFKKFFVDGVVQMARSMHVLTLPMPIYVDDCTLIGPVESEVNAQMEAFHDFAGDVCGVFFKVAKDRMAAQVQTALGFVWDSTTLTRELEGGKLLSYLDLLAEYSTRPTLTLREMQSVAGRMQRCIMTFPPGAAWLIVPVFMLMARLKLPHQRRRTTREVRSNFKYCADMLRASLGRGFYSFANFIRAPSIWTDASKSREHTGGGFFSACGRYDFWSYGKRAGRKLIDYLEGDTVVVACQRMAHLWSGCIVSIFCDNKAFEQSAAKGRSRVSRLNDLVKEIFLLMVKYRFVVDWNWISTHDNVGADHLSRNREEAFITSAYATECWSADTVPIRLEGAGRHRALPEKRGVIDDAEPKSASEESTTPASTLNKDAKAFVPANPVVTTSDIECADFVQRALAADFSGPKPRPAVPRARRGGSLMLVLAMLGCCLVGEGDAMPVTQQAASISYSRASIFTGLPSGMCPAVEQVLDNRLSDSSWRTVKAGLTIWRTVAADNGWSAIIPTDDSERGGKMTAFVMHMLEDTDLTWGTIQSYVWGVRVWQQSQHQLDPVMGVAEWKSFMDGVKVLSWVPGEPRRRFPVERVAAILQYVVDHGLDSFWMVQCVFLMLTMLYTFNRTENPCPKNHTGRESFDPDAHFGVRDFDIQHIARRRAMKVRFRRIKQDPRVERPEARGDGDWVVIGDIPDSIWSIVTWFLRLQKFHGHRPDRKAPMFVDPDDWDKALLYRKFAAQFKDLQRAIGVPEEEFAGPHGLRVEGFNQAKRGLGEDIAQAHGGWKSKACKRYDRFEMSRYVRIAAVIAQQDAGDEDRAERTAGPPRQRPSRRRLGGRRAKVAPSVVDYSCTDSEEDGSASGAGSLAEEGDFSGHNHSDPATESSSGEAAPAASSDMVSLTPGGATARPGGAYWGAPPTRPGPGERQYRRFRRSPSSSRS